MESAVVVRDTDVMSVSLKEPETVVTKHSHTSDTDKLVRADKKNALNSVVGIKDEDGPSLAGVKATVGVGIPAQTNVKQKRKKKNLHQAEAAVLLENAISTNANRNSFQGKTTDTIEKAGVKHLLRMKLLTRTCATGHNAESQDTGDIMSQYNRQGVHNIGAEQFIHIKQEIDDTDFSSAAEVQTETFTHRKQLCAPQVTHCSTERGYETLQTQITVKDEPAPVHQEQISQGLVPCLTFKSQGDDKFSNTSVKKEVYGSVPMTVTPPVVMHHVKDEPVTTHPETPPVVMHHVKDEPVTTHPEQISQNVSLSPTFMLSRGGDASVKKEVLESESDTVTPSGVMCTADSVSDTGFGIKPDHVFPVGLYQNVHAADKGKTSASRNDYSCSTQPSVTQSGINFGLSSHLPSCTMAVTDDKSLICIECGATFKRNRNLKKHMLIHTGEKPYVCKQCGKSFRQACTLKAHMVTHTGDKPFVCKQCGEAFSWFCQLKKHMMIHTGEKPHVCKHCGEAFRQFRQLKVHMGTHTVDKPYVCTECEKTFKWFSIYKRHMMTHTGDRPYPCTQCGAAFTQSSSLNLHMRIHTATDEKPYVCEQCGMAFTHSSSLKCHTRIHSGEKPFVCKQCGKAFIQSSGLKLHVRTHTGEKPYACKQCGAAFVSSSRLNAHMKIHTGDKPYVCEHCDRAFSQSSNLKKHLMIHADDKPHVCSECGAAFVQAGSLKYHMMIHTGDKPYACQQCGAAFRHSNTLKCHMMTHTGDRPYVCKQCGDTFQRSSSLKRHMLVHGGE